MTQQRTFESQNDPMSKRSVENSMSLLYKRLTHLRSSILSIPTLKYLISTKLLDVHFYVLRSWRKPNQPYERRRATHPDMLRVPYILCVNFKKRTDIFHERSCRCKIFYQNMGLGKTWTFLASGVRINTLGHTLSSTSPSHAVKKDPHFPKSN